MSRWMPPTTERERLARILRCVAHDAKHNRRTVAEALDRAAEWIEADDRIANEDLEAAESKL